MVLNMDFENQVSPEAWGQWLRYNKANWYVFQLEFANRFHFQGVVQFKNYVEWKPFAAATMAKFGLRGDQAVQCKAVDVNFKNYCMKQETHVAGPWEWGTYRGPGRKKKVDPIEEKWAAAQLEVTRRLVSHDWDQWHLMIIAQAMTEPPPRTINWIYDTIGNTGKSQLSQLLQCMGAAVLTGSAKHSLYGLSQMGPVKCVIIDIPRNTTTVNYSLLEKVKDGSFRVNLYESKQRMMPTPHVFVFANFPPNRFKLSADRWNIAEVVKGKLVYERRTTVRSACQR